jgi:hypothetical protein
MKVEDELRRKLRWEKKKLQMEKVTKSREVTLKHSTKTKLRELQEARASKI